MAATYTVRTKGAVAQYQKTGVTSSATITPYDSGTILGTVPPGKAGIKLVSGVVQRAGDLTADSTSGVTGNALVPVNGKNVLPTINSAQVTSNGLSLDPQHE